MYILVPSTVSFNHRTAVTEAQFQIVLGEQKASFQCQASFYKKGKMLTMAIKTASTLTKRH